VLSLGSALSANMFVRASEKPVKMKDLPSAVQTTVQEQSKGATVRGLSKETDNGKTYYEVELKVTGLWGTGNRPPMTRRCLHGFDGFTRITAASSLQPSQNLEKTVWNRFLIITTRTV
jgi:hypothetical protein